MDTFESGLLTLHLNQALRAMVVPALEALNASPREEEHLSGDALWALGSFYEASAWLCLGCDLGYFSHDETARVLRPLLEQDTVRAVPAEDRPLIIGNDWTEHLMNADLDQALAIQPFSDIPNETRALQPAFQAAWSFAARLATSEPLNYFLKTLLIKGEDWHREVLEGPEIPQVIRPDTPIWRQLVKGHPLDGLVALLHHLQVLATWAASTRSTDDSGETPGASAAAGEFTRGPSAFATNLLVSSIGKLLRWRLDLGNRQVTERLQGAISQVDERQSALRAAMAAGGYDINDPWPEGFQAAMKEALTAWDEITGEATQGRPTPPSDTGGGGEAVRMNEKIAAPAVAVAYA